MLNDDPTGTRSCSPASASCTTGAGTYKYESAARQGAAAAVIIHTTESAGYPWEVVRSGWTGEQFEVPAGDEPRLALVGLDDGGRGAPASSALGARPGRARGERAQRASSRRSPSA
jgi:hypothetical protein